ncbi:ferredoxin reductase-like protein [Gymnopus androsaceus JB14]|uniref:cytochrome-b5 reductase n=1 Tax=Gymnopus androsaceus JB14 TaxID=1447944 RepID=A0A6A4HNY1_9AGAR|nr:ferredoxin reductase-like protein [Gymnopus androsaceus JB14]
MPSPKPWGSIAVDSKEAVCLARPLDDGLDGDAALTRTALTQTVSEEPEIAYEHHGVIEATSIVRRAVARHAQIVSSGATPVHHQGLQPPGVFTFLTLKTVVKSTEDTSRFDFAFDDPEVVSDVKVSCTCIVRAPDEKPCYEDPGTKLICPPFDYPSEEGPFMVYRAYAPITVPGSVGILSLLVQKIPNGKMSNYIHSLKVGEKLGIMGYNQCAPSCIPWTINQYNSVTMLAEGTGLSRMLQILHLSLSDPNNKAKFFLLFGNDSESDIIMRGELDAMKQTYPGSFDVVYALSSPPQGWTGETGQIDAAMIQKYAPPPADPSLNKLICVAGPPAMVQRIAGVRDGNKYTGWTGQGALTGALLDLGYTAQQVRKF